MKYTYSLLIALAICGSIRAMENPSHLTKVGQKLVIATAERIQAALEENAAYVADLRDEAIKAKKRAETLKDISDRAQAKITSEETRIAAQKARIAKYEAQADYFGKEIKAVQAEGTTTHIARALDVSTKGDEHYLSSPRTHQFCEQTHILTPKHFHLNPVAKEAIKADKELHTLIDQLEKSL